MSFDYIANTNHYHLGFEVGMGSRAHDNILEMLVYRVASGQRAAFQELMEREVIAAMEGHGLTIVAYGASIHDADSYFVMRTFPSLEYRTQTLERCERSQGWHQLHEERMAPLLLDCSSAVLSCEAAGIETLKHTLSPH